MKSALQLLVDAPDNEVKRMQLIYKMIAAGEWSEAWFHLSNITTTENCSEEYAQWVMDVNELCDFCLDAKKVTKKSL